ncbi:MAG: 2-oxoglutarate dehydrogenase E1 component [Phycisphaeraceae bacterium]|nr:2-oxoglutarate dehydrogenase E1 component [Phycisphaeraceae bacterium]
MTVPPRAVSSSVNGWNAEFLDEQYRRYRADPSSVAPDVRAFFQGFDLASSRPAVGSGAAGQASGFQAAVGDLIEAYRTVGHMSARLDPFGRERARPSILELARHGLSEADLDRDVEASGVGLEGAVTLRQLISHLEERYCGTIGVEVMHVTNDEERQWLLDRFERGVDRSPLTQAHKENLLLTLLRAEQFEQFIGKRYPGDKRFSLEGSESLIPLLEHMLGHVASLGVEEVVLGMAHRGRLNVLNNILGKTYQQIFTEFEDTWSVDFADGGGDVKYHRGYSATRTFGNDHQLHLAMASNPSHLESVDGVVMGRCRAKQRLRADKERRRVIPLLIHGDAALPGQGIVAETLNMSQLEGYTVGGTIHVVVNNLIGFTTAPEDGRSTPYCTDIAKSIEAPVLHVNGEDPEAVLACAHFAAEYRHRFRKDVFVDLWCYRKYGHNEQDEASFTQPILYSLIREKKSVLTGYAERLLAEGTIAEDHMRNIREGLTETLDQAQRQAKETPRDPTIDPGSARWSGLKQKYTFERAETGVPRENLAEVCRALGRVPEGFSLHPKLKRLLDERAGLLESRNISYADAESLAFGTLLLDGNPVRLTGQDCRRGTFSHRHAVLRDQNTGAPYTPLNNIRAQVTEPDLRSGPESVPGQQARFCVHDSPLSEVSVLAFDYGYSLADPNMLVMWEAQFGDFANGAQAIIDQYLASAEAKWQRWSGLVLLLPHGYEGAGPEHSSARLERFLQLYGDGNFQVIYPTTAGQIFHALRRQVRRSFRKPLVVMTPKSMLRTNTGVIEDLMSGGFEEVLDDPALSGPGAARAVRRIVLCTGKLYHEMASRREAAERSDVALVRIEQLCPLHTDRVREVIERYPRDAEIVWAQEEPRNMGAFLFVTDHLRKAFAREDRRFLDMPFIGREESASPATGSKKVDRAQQERIVSLAVGAGAESKPQRGTKTVPAA